MPDRHMSHVTEAGCRSPMPRANHEDTSPLGNVRTTRTFTSTALSAEVATNPQRAEASSTPSLWKDGYHSRVNAQRSTLRSPLTPSAHFVLAKFDPSLWLSIPFELSPHLSTSTPHTETMATRKRQASVPFLDDRIDNLYRNTVEASLAKQVLRTVADILVLVRVSALILHPSINSLTTRPGQDD